MGRELQHGDLGSATTEVDISALAPGLYVLNIGYADSKQIDGVKLVKQ